MSLSTTLPQSLRAGDSAAWSLAIPDHLPADGWALKFRMLWAQDASVDFGGTPDADVYTVSLSATDTANWTAGNATLAWWVERTVNGALERLTLGSQALLILPDLTQAATLDNRSQARIGLEAARAALVAYVAAGQSTVAEYEIAGRKMKFRDVSQIRELIQHFEREVNKEVCLQALLGTANNPAGAPLTVMGLAYPGDTRNIRGSTGGMPGRVLTRF